jgi:benzoyl-CoA reductase subunit C
LNESKFVKLDLDSWYEGRLDYLREVGGKKTIVIGYLCAFVPAEIMTAAGVLPLRILGDTTGQLSAADRYLESNICPYVRNCFESIISDKYGVDGLVFPASCDAIERVYGVLTAFNEARFMHFLHVPKVIGEASSRFFAEELKSFAHHLGSFLDVSLDDDKVRQAIKIHNENKRLIKQFYELRRDSDYSFVSLAKLLVLGMSITAHDFNSLLRECYGSLLHKAPSRGVSKPRVLLMGCINDIVRLTGLIEEAGARVVIDDTCIGTKTYANLVEEAGDPFEALADTYFTRLLCPRTYRKPGETRFHYLVDLIQQYSVDGVIVYYLKYCDPYGFDYPLVRDVLNRSNVQVLRIEDDYSMRNTGALKTRIQAFCEMIAGRSMK